MSEMLANQYFLARQYLLARTAYEVCLKSESQNKSFKKKLIICYTQTGELSKALELFYSLISEDIEFIIDTDPLKDDCPCNELIKKYSSELSIMPDEIDELLRLGILWLYCDKDKSLEFFQKAHCLQANSTIINSILLKINSYLKNQLTSKSNNQRS